MVDFREILRLLNLGYNLTQISESLHSSRNTIRDVRNRANKIRLSLSENVTNRMLYELLYPERLEKANVWMNPDCEYIHKELVRKGVNIKLLWTEYKVSCENAVYRILTPSSATYIATGAEVSELFEGGLSFLLKKTPGTVTAYETPHNQQSTFCKGVHELLFDRWQIP